MTRRFKAKTLRAYADLNGKYCSYYTNGDMANGYYNHFHPKVGIKEW